MLIPDTMWSYLNTGPAKGRLHRVDTPVPGPRDVLVRVRMTGVCASELHDWIAGVPSPLGHEPVGVVVAAGAEAATPVGAWVTGRLEPAFAEYVLAADADVVRVPDDIDPLRVLGEPVGCVVEGLRRTRLPDGASVAVIGTGFMGLVMVQLLAHSLARHVVAIDVREDARAAAIANGADEAREPSAALGLADDVEVVIEASGTAPGLDLATKLVRPHGILSILGFHVGERRVDLETWNYKALDVVNAHVRDERLMRAAIETGVQLQAAGRIDAGALITHRFALDQVDDAFSALRDKPVGFVKSVVEWDG